MTAPTLIPADIFAGYDAHPAITQAMRDQAERLCRTAIRLLRAAQANGVTLDLSPATGTIISLPGGGWRPPEYKTGAPNSAHKQGMAVDLHDPDGDLDSWIMGRQYLLADLGLAIEHPASTRGWCHITTRIPPSGNRVFYP